MKEEIHICFELENHRSAAYDGKKFVGECSFEVISGIWYANHTQVDPAYGGRQIARKLVQELVKQARYFNVKIQPVCSYVIREFEKFPEYADIKF